MENAELEEFINTVRERSDIYEVVSRYVPLNLKGGRFWACCPFHEEKTPSFTISPDKGIFYCFGCHKGGNVFKFISLMEHTTYFEAVKLQAERLGIKLPARNKTPAEVKAEQVKDALFKIANLARDFYHNCLIKSKEGEQCRKYLAARGITEETIREFKLGFAPDSWDAFTRRMKIHGFTEKQLVNSGLAVERKSGGGVYDRMRGRVIIPISNISGKVVAFGGRILISDDNQPKYLNTPETEIFSKGKMFFGLDRSNQAIIAENTAIVVEGYMDSISLFSAGVKNVVASLGTAFTDEHAKILSRYARRVIFCYDSDEAGQRATVRALPMMRSTGAEVFILIIPDGKDPDEFIKKNGKDAFKQLLKNVLPFMDYQFQYKLKHIDFSTYEGKIQILREMLTLCREVKNPVTLRKYFLKFANVLVLDEDLVFEEWKKIGGQPSKFQSETTKIKISKKSLACQAGRTIIRAIWYDIELLNYIKVLIPKEIFIKTHIEIIDYIEKCYDAEKLPDDLTATNELSAESNLELSRILGTIEPQEVQMSAFNDSVKIMQGLVLKKRRIKILRELKELLKTGDEKSCSEKFQESLKIQKELDELKI